MMKALETFVYWYPIVMSTIWMIGGLVFLERIERKKPLPVTKTPMVSILIACHNEADTIASTIERLNHLDYPHYEIIAIDDGSTDKTFAVLSKLLDSYERLRIVQMKKNAGKANALYHGLLCSKGEILVGVDADSYLEKDALLYMIPHFTNHNSGERVGAVTGNPRVRNRSSLLSKIQLCEYASIISLTKRTQRILGKVMTVSGVCVAYRKRALLDCHLWDRDLQTEDVAVTWKLEKKFWDVRYEPKALCWMLVPEKLSNLWKQRRRWTTGGIEVLWRNRDVYVQWTERRLYLVGFEQLFSCLWAICWLILLIIGVINLLNGADVFTYFWKSQFLSVICLAQFITAMILDSRYDKTLTKNCLWAIWYPLVFWYINSLVVLVSIPKTIFMKRGKYAVWKSPDRGLKGDDDEERVADNDSKAKAGRVV